MLTSCPNCAVRLRVADDKIGKTVRCPKCNHMFQLASPGTTASPTAGSKPPIQQPASAKSNSTSPARPVTRASVPPAVRAAAESDQSETVPEVGPAATQTASRPSRKKKKKRSSNTTLILVVGLSIVLGIGAIAGVGYAVWYFAFSRRSVDRAAREFLDILDSFVAAVEKAKDASQRAQAVSEMEAVTQRLEGWIDKYKDIKPTDAEVKEVEEKYRGRAEELGKRFLSAFLTMAQKDSQVFLDQQFTQTMQRFAETLARVPPDLAHRSRFQPSPGSKPMIPTPGLKSLVPGPGYKPVLPSLGPKPMTPEPGTSPSSPQP